MLNAKNYDQLEDLRNIDVYVQSAIEKLKTTWKTGNTEIIIEKIKFRTIQEI